LFLDACRDNPFPEQLLASSGKAVTTSHGLAHVSADFGSLIAFSTAPGTVALDGDGNVSPFTSAFLARASEPNTEIRKTLTKVRADVREATHGQQVPWDNSSLLKDFFFVPPRQPPVFDKLSIVALKLGEAARSLPLNLQPPRQPEGGSVRISIDSLPRFGTLRVGGQAIGRGEVLTSAQFARMNYEAGRAGSLHDAFSFRVEDEWNNRETGFVTVAVDGSPSVASFPPPSPTKPAVVAGGSPEISGGLQRLSSDLGRIRLAGTSLLGLGPNLSIAGAPVRGVNDGGQVPWLRLTSAPSRGQLRLGDRVIDRGRSITLPDVTALTFLPSIGTSGQTTEAVFQAEPTASGEVTLLIESKMHDCDRLAGHKFDFQGVAQGVLPYELDSRKARPACETAVQAYPHVARFHHQLGRAYFAEGRNREAFEAFSKAGVMGHVRAIAAVGWFHQHGLFVAPDQAKANAAFAQAAGQGDVVGIHLLGDANKLGLGMPKDSGKARELYEKSARVGHTNSMNSLGELYSLGEGVQKDDALAQRYWQASADRGDVFGVSNLGFIFLNGSGVPKDYRKAIAFFRRAADRGHPGAPNQVGRMYLEGLGVTASATEAIRWFRLGSARGDAWAAYNLAEVLRVGLGVAQDQVAATRSYARAAALPQKEPSDMAKAIVKTLPVSTKLRTLRQILTSLDPRAAELPSNHLLSRATAIAQERGIEARSESLDDVLVAISRAEWLSSGARLDVL
jgi:TPR repeat protein